MHDVLLEHIPTHFKATFSTIPVTMRHQDIKVENLFD